MPGDCGSLERRSTDLVILTVLATLSVVPYVLRLGFYSDDLGFLAMLLDSPDQSLRGLIAIQYPNDNLRMRPTQMVYQAVLFKAFGLRPLGYQLVNAAVLAAAVLFLYLMLREIAIPRTVARAVSVVYLLLPNYSTDRVWFAAFGYTLTAALFLLSTYASFRALRSNRFIFWFGLSLLPLMASLLGMEVFLPLTLAIPLGLWLQSRKSFPEGVGAHFGTLKTVLVLGAPIAIAGAIVFYKAENAVGAALPDLWSLVRLAVGSVTVNFGTYGLALPHTLAWSMRQLTLAAMVWPCVLGVIVFLWLSRGEDPADSRRFWIVLVMSGGLVFCLGSVIFVVTPRVGFWSTGIANRVWIAAALGVAAVLVGATGWLTSGLSTGLHRYAFAALIATLCASCFAIDVALSAYWVNAWPHQLEVLAKMQRVQPHPRSGTTLMLYGACPYLGPAIAFESPWDFAGARKVVYRDSTLGGDVLDDARPGRFGTTEEGLWTKLYSESRFYHFGPDLLLFDYRAGEVRPLVDRASAVAGVSKPTDCPSGVAGGGTVLLPLDNWYAKTSAKLWRLRQ